MEILIKHIEKRKSFFEKISRNKYLRAIRDGFISAMPIVLFSSIFMLIAFAPNIFGIYWSKEIEAIILKPYNYSMGILSIVVAATTAKNFVDALNRDMPGNNQINNISVMIAAIVCFLTVSVDSIEGGFANGYMGSKGLITAFISAFVVGNIYKLCVKYNVTIKMPEAVPPNISQTFKDIIPFGISAIIFWLFDLGFRNFFQINFAEGVIQFFQPLFTAADGYVGLAIIYGAMALFWFVGIQGPSIVEPAVSAIYYVNISANLSLFQNGEHAYNILTPGVQQFVATLGGTGATLVVTLMFAFLSKSKELKSVGRASSIPVLFGVNEPILFGAPLILNPIFFIPFIGAPIINVWLFKFFVDFFKMNSFMYILPWTTPSPIGIVLGCGLGILNIVFAVLVLVVDFIIYYPFFKVYDDQKVEEELQKVNIKCEDNSREESRDIDKELVKNKKVLVLCAGGGTSGLLANALSKAAKQNNINMLTAANSYGAHVDMLKDFDLVILAPQVASNYEDLKKDTDKLGIKAVAVEGKKYIELTRNPSKALDFVNEILNK
ncbi:PTS lactose transporter subunit IIBC (plasmid) [Clostridium perfringens]|uniref:PTS system lactose-specific EIICB component n=1 Tax=Clostridium perfringens E str. JGS1987 TaxID=451755 RepID=B1BU33_CLOPF|nr:PTS lactose transporter subunit IIBC [Clostridium perfringens]EDT14819.1 pts system lactose-specific eiicb component [Clostridium perfringens E str. JGS1987]ELC8464190.1 PTS lactose transporter subunit IIBC [Clostridium perfringens]MDT7988947.1 PTS lactose transporter subunit IIBC [Clostridium perfringens]WVM62154.1 PTS lactose transporter subunit IIBC [Clostridium perfringens]